MIREVTETAAVAPQRPTATRTPAFDLLARGGGPIANVPARVHLLGAGGAGVSGAGLVLLGRGHVITGHDRADSRFVEVLRRRGAHVDLGPSRAELLPADAQMVVRSAAVPADDPQVLEAERRGLPVLKHAQLLARVAPAGRTLAVAGTHGKTTTSWMLYWALRGIASSETRPNLPGALPGALIGALPGALPGALIGGVCRTLGSNAVAPEPGGWFACEACEYDRTFLELEPDGAIVTNVEADHLDYYGSLAAIEEAFGRFVDRVHPEGLVVAGREVPEGILGEAPCPVWKLGRELEVADVRDVHGRHHFRLIGPGWATGEIALSVPGVFNVDNAALAIALAVGRTTQREGDRDRAAVARAVDAAARAVGGYCGAERRFEPWGTAGGVEVFHDYAHHPTEVRVTIEAARRSLPGKPLHVLFQPHQHSRTARFLQSFVESLSGADRVVVADVYGARAHIDTEAAGAEELVARLRKAGVDAVRGGPPAESAKVLCAGLCGQSAALILGAGDIDLVQHDLLEELALRGPGGR